MKIPKEFKVKIEKEITVTLDMDKYSGDTLKQISSWWGYDYDMTDEEIINESIEDIAAKFESDGYLDKELEGFPIDGQTAKLTNYNFYIVE